MMSKRKDYIEALERVLQSENMQISHAAVIEECTLKEIVELLKQYDWIPTAKVLPPKDGEYIATGKWDDKDEYTSMVLDYGSKVTEVWDGDPRVFENGSAFGELWHDGIDNVHDVIAWMPMPDPYQGPEAGK